MCIRDRLQTEEEIKKYVHEHVLDIANGEVRNWGGKDLFVHVCALYATKFRKECIDIIDAVSYTHLFNICFSNSGKTIIMDQMGYGLEPERL